MTTPEPLPQLFIPLNAARATLESVGVKALNLAKLAAAGFPVPNGFFIPTTLYREFVAHNGLSRQIQSQLNGVDPAAPGALSGASESIRALFRGGDVPAGLPDALEIGWRWLGAGSVAVRSSATAEDLPDMSFAGQQDTYLNIAGPAALLEAVVHCWGSLWTARAIGYRQRNGIPHHDAALAVVVQKMVQSEASGVLFTANPLTGLRSETVIDATLGLGEALVGGQVEPDHYVVDTLGPAITHKFIGAKSVVISGNPEGGVITREADSSQRQAVPDDVILQLAGISKDIEKHFDFPQDIEWAWAEHQLTILQSRPITSLFPLPERAGAHSLRVFFSLAAVQGMLDPFTPLGRDALYELFTAGAGMFGIRVTRETQNVLFCAGERLWVNFTTLLCNSVGRRLIPVVLKLVEPSIGQAIETIWDDPRLQPERQGIRFRSLVQIARFVVPLAANILRNLIAPRRRREAIIGNGEQVLEEMEARIDSIKGDRWQKLEQQADLLPDLAAGHFQHTLLLFVSGVAAGMVSWNVLNMLANDAADQPDETAPDTIRDLVLQLTRGMPFNPTTEMDLTLWKMTRAIREDPASCQVFQSHPAAELAQRYLAGELPEAVMGEVGTFLDRYGGRGLGEIDLGRVRWAEDPAYIFETLAGFLKIEDEGRAPDVVFARGAESASQAIDQLAAAVRKTPGGWIKAGLVRFFAGRARQLMGARESPKFFAVRVFWQVQRALLKTGGEFVRSGELDRPEDVFYLSLSELKSFAAQDESDWRSRIAARRQAYQHEMLRVQIPRLLLSDGRALYEGVDADEASGEALSGSPVSPGSVEGRVRVVLNPTRAGLLPGEILVCPGTDPSWTPLFLTAAGLVMEVGGMMTHGAVVAREYGIPAIVGVHQATTCLHTGQLIRIDGSSGQILLLEEPEPGETN
ncbi:MAG: hypothetical protein JXA97_13300 [Anaerolineales bacterium]|nr:hypothetical protein [Anaerolineales bacterium]